MLALSSRASLCVAAFNLRVCIWNLLGLTGSVKSNPVLLILVTTETFNYDCYAFTLFSHDPKILRERWIRNESVEHLNEIPTRNRVYSDGLVVSFLCGYSVRITTKDGWNVLFSPFKTHPPNRRLARDALYKIGIPHLLPAPSFDVLASGN